MDKIRMAVQGSGIIAHSHARACQMAEGVDLVAAANWQPESLARLAKEWEIPRTTTRFEELADDPNIDAVIITLPNFLHKNEAVRMLRAGKHVLLEKPMAMNVAEAEEILDAAREADRRLMIGFMWRFDIEVNWLRRAIADGLLGDVVRTKGYHANPAGVGPVGWFNECDKAGGGVVIDMAVHSLDTTRFLLGEPQAVSVYATMGTRFSTYEVEDDATLLVHWDNGAYSTIVATAWQPFQDAPEGAHEVWGTRGYGRLFPSVLHLPLADARGSFSPSFSERKEQCGPLMYQRQIEYLADCIRSGKEPRPGGVEGLATMKIIEAIYQSAHSKQLVKI